MTRAYQPEIDGLRAIAVTAVILFHSHIVPLPGGFAGVDVFFVLSGYLITGILLHDWEAGRWSLRQFYARRIRRIFPALFVVLTSTSLAAWQMLNPPQLEAYAKSVLAVVLFVSNFLFAANTGYFSPALDEAPLLHTWSLAVEEQFYLFFPLVLLAFVRWRARRVFLVVLALALASLALSIWGARHEAQLNFFFTFSRMWELLARALAAIWRRDHPLRPQGGLAAAGLAAIVASMVLHSAATPYPGLATLLPVLGTVAVILFAGQSTGVGRLLSLRPMVWVGLISYSAYLWHQPLFALARATAQDVPGVWMMAGLTALTFGLAWLTWALVEQPFRRTQGRWLAKTGPLFGAAALGSALLVALAVVGMASRGNDAGWRSAHPDRAAQLDLILAAQKGKGLPSDAGPCRFNVTVLDQPARSRIADCAARLGPAAVVLGDSHAIDVYTALTQQSAAPFLLGITNGGCRLAEADADCAFAAFADMAESQPSLFAHVLYVQAGANLLLGPDGQTVDRQIFARTSALQPLPAVIVDDAELAKVAAYLAQIGAHVPVTWLASRLEPHIASNRVLAQDCAASVPLRPGLADVFAAIDQKAAMAARAAALDYIRMDALGYDQSVDFMSCEALYWSDGDHWSLAGEKRFGQRLLPRLPIAFQ